jgi:hypothetical protein
MANQKNCKPGLLEPLATKDIIICTTEDNTLTVNAHMLARPPGPTGLHEACRSTAAAQRPVFTYKHDRPLS